MYSIHPDALIGDNVVIHDYVVIGPNVTIDNGCIIGPFCAIGTPGEHPRMDYANKGRVFIGEGSRLYSHATVNSPLEDTGTTYVGAGCTLMAGAHVGHDCSLGYKVTLACGVRLGGHTFVGDHCTLGLNSVTHQRTIMPAGCMVGGLTFMKGEYIKPFRKFVGIPARDIGENTYLKTILPYEDWAGYADLLERPVNEPGD